MPAFLQSLSLSAHQSWTYAGAVVIGAVTWYLASNTTAAKAKRVGSVLAPGPKRIFLLGNIFNFPNGRWYEAFTQWAGEYGDIIYIDLAGIPMIVLNSLDAIRELTEKRMSIHSGRPHTTLVCDMMGFDFFLSIMQPTKDFTEQRRLFQKAIGPQSVQQYDSSVQDGSSELLKRLGGFSGEPLGIVVETLGRVLTRIAYGEHFLQHHGAEVIKHNIEAFELVSRAFTQFWLVNVIPALRYLPTWFPGAKFKRIGQEGKRYSGLIRYWSLDRVKAAMSEGITDESILSRYMDDKSFSEDNLRDATAAMYAAGVDTTATAILHLLFSVALYPEWQHRIHEEMDQVLGRDHTLTIDDIPKLPIFNAVFKESFRWNPAAPIGVPHVSSQEDVWNGYYIPKGSIIHCNLGVFVLRDPRLWGKDGQDFNPNRFLLEHNPLVNELPDIWTIPFGSGKRICPGRYLALRTATLYSAAILSAYQVSPYEGEILTPNEPFETSGVRRLSHFRCTFKPRL